MSSFLWSPTRIIFNTGCAKLFLQGSMKIRRYPHIYSFFFLSKAKHCYLLIQSFLMVPNCIVFAIQFQRGNNSNEVNALAPIPSLAHLPMPANVRHGIQRIVYRPLPFLLEPRIAGKKTLACFGIRLLFFTVSLETLGLTHEFHGD